MNNENRDILVTLCSYKKKMKDVVNYCSLSHIDCSIGHVLETVSVPI